MNLLTLIAVSALLATIGCSFFEWWLHKNVMHKAPLGFDYAFEAHAKVHHNTFKADSTYHLQEGPHKDKHKKTIPMAWWNGPMLISITTIPFLVASLKSGYWSIFWTSVVIGILYYSAYEYMHWCMHLPRRRRIERTGIFFRLNGHHLLHHRYMHKNFNVVLPLADLILGTLLLRSKVSFMQAQGPSVPDVQPRIMAWRS